MRSWVFQAFVLGLLALLATGVWLHAANGHYQFVKSNGNDIVIDTRTGEFWETSGDGTAHVNVHTATVETGRLKLTEQPPQPAASATSSSPAGH